MISLDLSDNVKIGQNILLRVKPTSVAIGKNIQGELSYSNQLNVKIISLKVGKLLCSLQLQFHDFLIESIITVDSQKRMNLQLNDEVLALIKSSDLSIGEVL
jgi:molybdopterin-binding protein